MPLRMPLSWQRLALLLIICVVPTTLLWSFRQAPFVSDDRWFATGALIADGSTWLMSRWPHPFGPANAWRPLVILSYLLTRAWSDGTPIAYHLTNFALHGLNAALLAAIIWRLGGSLIAGFIGGLLFAIHPMTHENVVWISGRTYPLAALFGLALLWWTASGHGRSMIVQHAVGIALLAGALMSYEAAVTLPVMVGVLWFALDGRHAWLDRLRAMVMFAAPYVIVLALYFAFRWFVVSSLAGDTDVWRHGTAPSPFLKSGRIRLFENVVAFATRLFTGDYDARFDGVNALRICATMASATLAAIAVWGAAGVGHREVRWRAIGAIVLAGVAFVPGALATAFIDRLTYLSLAGVLCALALGLSAMLVRAGRVGRSAIVAVAMLAAVCWAAELRGRGAEWQHAGDIAESLLDQLVALEPAPPPGASLHFLDVPLQFRSAYIFVTYFHHSVRQRYHREDLDVITHNDGPPLQGVVIFRWDQQTERLQRYEALR